MINSKNHWFLIRGILLVGAILDIFIEPLRQGPGWITNFLMFLFFPVVIIFYLYTLYNMQRPVDWTDTFSLTKPFLPIQTYPTQFLVLSGIGGLLVGAISGLHDCYEIGNISSYSGMMFLAGASTIISIIGWGFLFKKLCNKLNRIAK